MTNLEEKFDGIHSIVVDDDEFGIDDIEYYPIYPNQVKLTLTKIEEEKPDPILSRLSGIVLELEHEINDKMNQVLNDSSTIEGLQLLDEAVDLNEELNEYKKILKELREEDQQNINQGNYAVEILENEAECLHQQIKQKEPELLDSYVYEESKQKLSEIRILKAKLECVNELIDKIKSNN